MRELRKLLYGTARLLGWGSAFAGGIGKLLKRILNVFVGRKIVSKLWWR